MLQKIIYFTSLFLTLFILSSCGSGGSNTNTSQTENNITNTLPRAFDQNITVDKNTSNYLIALTGLDKENDITYSLQTQPTHGVLNGTPPNLTYTPITNYTGSDSFTFSVNDGELDSSVAMITITVNEAINELWSDVNTWGSNLPQENDIVTISTGKHIILDTNIDNLGGIVIEEGAVLEFARKDINLSSKYIVVNGLLEIGTEEEPFMQKAILTINDINSVAQGMGTRGIVVNNGTLELHGATPSILWTKLNQNADAGETTLTLKDSVSWNVGDEVMITPTDYYEAANGNSVTQKVSLAQVNNNSLTLAEGLNAQRWGRLQYVTDNEVGLSLNPEDILVDANITSPLILDERAEIANITRNIVIQAPDDTIWRDEGFGVHTMIMPNGTGHVEGVEFKRAGQRGKIGRYPFHWHMLSYADNELLSDATGQYFKNNSITHSSNRGIVIHGTNGLLVQNNIIFDIKGHGIFLEDAVERRNIIDGNLIFKIRHQEGDGVLLQHETGQMGASAIWLSNPDNIITNNVVGDAQSFGYWLAFPTRTWGFNTEVKFEDGTPLNPRYLKFGAFKDNQTHSNKRQGFFLDRSQTDVEGNTNGRGNYGSTIDDKEGEPRVDTDFRRYTLDGIVTWKNLNNGIWDRSDWVDNINAINADNAGRFFAGAGDDGVITGALVVGESLNYNMNGTLRPELADFQFHVSGAPTAFASYHSNFSMHDNVVVNFFVTEYDRAGVFATDDLYLRAVERGLVRNFNNHLINADPGVKLAQDNPRLHFTLSSALWDPYGLWGPAENYIVYDIPYLTYGKEIYVNPLGTDVVGGVSVSGPFYGFRRFVPNGIGETVRNGPNRLGQDFMAIQVDRYDMNMNHVGIWEVEESAILTEQLGHMRDFATSPDGLYILSFPNNTQLPNDFRMSVSAMYEESDQQVLGISFDGSITNLNVFLEGRGEFPYTQLNSKEEVITSNGETWWQDSTNNIVWVKIRGGRWTAAPEQIADLFNVEQEERMWLHIELQE